MTLDKAIQHCEEVAKEKRIEANYRIPPKTACLECAEEHEQLAEWLTQLKNIREAYMTGEVFNLMAACMEAFGEVNNDGL